MSRIPTPATIETAPAAAQAHLNAVKAQLGKAPNMFRLIANSPAALDGFLGLTGALGKGALAAPIREKIALAVANVNGCDYCNSAHTYISSALLKAPDDEIALNRTGRSGDPKADAAIILARKVTVSRGAVSADDIDLAKSAGLSDAELVEIVAHVAVNVFTNYINEVFKTEIDFPAQRAARIAQHA